MPALTRRATLISPLALLAACQPQPTQLGPHLASFLVFRTAITNQSADFYNQAIDRFVERGATEIRVGLTCPGGLVSAAERMLTHMDRAHADHGVTFTLYNVGLVASAACYVFLGAQRRFCIPNGAFLFHQQSIRATGPITAQDVRTAVQYMDSEDRHFLSLLTQRTKLTEGEALSFIRRTVILSASEAQRDGITEGTGPFVVPQGVDPSDIRAKEDTKPLPVTRLQQT